MKKYIVPSLKVVNIESNNILAGSGVGDGDSVGRNYSGSDVSYGRGHRGPLDWDDDED